MANILEEILAGRRMSNEEFAYLYQHADLLTLGQAANQAREKRFQNNIATFIIDRNINYTNICTCQCKFCAFYRHETDADAYVIDKNTLFAKIQEAIELGASQLMIQGGLNPNLKIDFFEDMFRSIKERYDITIHSLTARSGLYCSDI